MSKGSRGFQIIRGCLMHHRKSHRVMVSSTSAAPGRSRTTRHFRSGRRRRPWRCPAHYEVVQSGKQRLGPIQPLWAWALRLTDPLLGPAAPMHRLADAAEPQRRAAALRLGRPSLRISPSRSRRCRSGPAWAAKGRGAEDGPARGPSHGPRPSPARGGHAGSPDGGAASPLGRLRLWAARRQTGAAARRAGRV
jgi:hypothetical protein